MWIAWNEGADRWAAQTDSTTIQVWDSNSTRPIRLSMTEGSPITTIMISDDGRLVATGSSNGAVRLWDTDTGKPIGEPLSDPDTAESTSSRGVTRIAISHDGQLVAASRADRTLRLWDTRTFKPVGGPINLDETVVLTAFSRDGRTLAAGSIDGSIRLWDVRDQSQLGAPLKGPAEPITSLDFSPDGAKLVSGSDDGTLRMWPVPRPSPDVLCAKLTHNMSRQQWNDEVSSEIPYIKVCPDLPIAADGG